VEPEVAPVRVPLQLLLTFGELATCIPEGKVSLTARPVSVTVLPDGLVMVRVSVEVPFTVMLVGENDLAIVGATSTARVAEAVPPVPPSVELTVPVVLFLTPVLVAVTLTEMVHEALAASVPPDQLIELEPAVAVIVPVLQVPPCVATTNPEGKLSVKATPLRLVPVFGLVRVKVRVLFAFSATDVGENDLLMVGGPTTVCNRADEVLPAKAVSPP